MTNVGLVLLAGGLSSRFGGQPKCLVEVGPNDESLLELILNNAIAAGINKILIVTSEKLVDRFDYKLGVFYKEIPVIYSIQSHNIWLRDKPWGTVDALESAFRKITGPFIVCNSDDLVGTNDFKQLVDHIEQRECTSSAMITYPLSEMLPKQGEVTRGIVQESSRGLVHSFQEMEGLTITNYLTKVVTGYGLGPSTPCNANLFCFFPSLMGILTRELYEFKFTHSDSREKELPLSVALDKLIKRGNLIMKMYPSKEPWMGITNSEDEVVLRDALAKG